MSGLVLFSFELSVSDKVKIVDRMTTKPTEWNVRGDAMILKKKSAWGILQPSEYVHCSHTS